VKGVQSGACKQGGPLLAQKFEILPPKSSWHKIDTMDGAKTAFTCTARLAAPKLFGELGQPHIN